MVAKNLLCQDCCRAFLVKAGQTKKGPVILECGHSVCEDCFLSALTKCQITYSCPVCSKETLASQKRPPDYYTNGYVLFNRKRATGEVEINFKKSKSANNSQSLTKKSTCLCDECTQNVAVLKCSSCVHNFCKSCFSKIHSSSKLMMQHAPVSFNQPDEDGQTIVGTCSLHDNRSLEYYCKDDESVICSHCTIAGEHQNHDVIPLQERNETLLNDLKPFLEEAESVQRRMKYTRKKLGQHSGTSRIDVTSLLVNVRQIFQQLHGLLQLREMKLCEELECASFGERDHLSTMCHQLDDEIKKMNNLLKSGKDALAQCSLNNLNVEELLKELKASKSSPCHLVTNDMPESPTIQFLGDANEIIKSIESYGTVNIKHEPSFKLANESELPDDYVIADITDSQIDIGEVVASESTFSDHSIPEQPHHHQTSQRALGESRIAAVFPSQQKQQYSYSKSVMNFCQESVKVTHIKSPNHFYVQRSSQMNKIKQLQNRLKIYSQRPEKADDKPILRVNEMCMAKYANDNQWYRGQITKIYSLDDDQPTEVEVFYVDFGNQERMQLSRLRSLPSALVREPELALRCSLWDIVPAGDSNEWSDEVIKIFAQFVCDSPVMITVIRENPEVYEVDLLLPPSRNIKVDIPFSVRETLVLLEVACFCNPGILKTPYAAALNRHFYAADPLKKGINEDVTVCHVENPDHFYVQRLGVFADYFSDCMNQMEETYSRSNSSTCQLQLVSPVKGQVCVAQFSGDGKYYRAEIEGVSSSQQIDVVYVDYGNRERVNYWQIKKIEDRFMIIPKQAIKCRLADILPKNPLLGWEDSASRMLEKLAHLKRLKIYLDDSCDGVTHSVTLYDSNLQRDICINAQLVEQGCAIGIGTSMVEFSKVNWNEVKEREVEPQNYPVPEPVMKRSKNKRKREQSDAKKDIKEQTIHKNKNSSVASSIKAKNNCTSSEGVIESATAVPINHVLVTVSYCESPDVIYILLQKEMDALESMMLDMQATYSNQCFSATSYAWKVGDTGAAFIAGEHTWYRVEITKIDLPDDSLQVQLVDYGRTIQIPSKDCTVLKKQFLEYKAFAILCHLSGIIPSGGMDTWSGFGCDLLRTIIDKSKNLYIVKTKEEIKEISKVRRSLPIDLISEETKSRGALEPIKYVRISLAKSLIERGLAFPVEASDSKSDLSVTNSHKKESNSTIKMENGYLNYAGPDGDNLSPESPKKSVENEDIVEGNSENTVCIDSPIKPVSPRIDSPIKMASPHVNSPIKPVAPIGSPIKPVSPRVVSPIKPVSPHVNSPIKAVTPEKDAEENADTDDRRRNWADDLNGSEEHFLEEEEEEVDVEDTELPLGLDAFEMNRVLHQELHDGGENEREMEDMEKNVARLENLEKDRVELVDWRMPKPPKVKEFYAVPTHVTMAGTIALHSHPDGTETLTALKKKLNEKFKGSEPRPPDLYWFEGQPCVARFFLDNCWYRARVLKVHDENVSVLFVDYGNPDKVDPCDLRKNIFTEEVPILGLMCELYGIVPIHESGLTVKTLDFIHGQIVEKLCCVNVHHYSKLRKRLIIDLRIEESGVNLSDVVVELGEARFMSEEELITHYQMDQETEAERILRYSPYDQLYLSPSREPIPIIVTAMAGDNLVFVQPQLMAEAKTVVVQRVMRHVKSFNKMQLELNDKASEFDRITKPTVGMACIGKYSVDSGWYRAVILSVNDNDIDVFYVDFGNSEIIEKRNLRSLPVCYLTTPAQVVLCQLHRVHPATDEGYTKDIQDALSECLLFNPKVPLWAWIKNNCDPVDVDIVWYDENCSNATSRSSQLAYQQLVDDNLIVIGEKTKY